MAQATDNHTTSRFHNLSNEALADALGHADAVLKGAEAECKSLKDEFPSLGSLDGRMSQKRWAQHDNLSQWWLGGGDRELDEAEQEVGIEDLPHDPEQWW